MKDRTTLLICVLGLVFGLPPQTFAEGNVRGTLPDYAKRVKPFFQKYCFGCHASDTAKGGMRLDQLSPIVADEHSAEAWQEVLDVLNGAEMPPEDAKQPGRDELAEVIGHLTDGLFDARKRLVDKREVTIRRLNQREYANTIRDLLGVPVDTKDFPDDGTVDGFDTVGEAHFMSVTQFESYLELGRQTLDRALVAGRMPERSVSRIDPERDRNKKAKGDPIGEAYLAQPASQTGFILDLTQKPFGGQRHDKAWVALPRADQAGIEPNGLAAATIGRPIGRYVARFRVGLTCPPEPGRRLYVELVRTDAFTQQVTYTYPLGTFEVTSTMDEPQIFEIPFENLGETRDLIAVQVSELNAAKRGDRKKTSRRDKKDLVPDSSRIAHVWLDWLEVEGPFIDQWPPAAWRQTFFKGLPGESTDESAYAREIIERFAYRAFRHREPSKVYVDKLHAIYAGHRKDGASFVESVKESLAVVLASPSFAYMVERPAAGKSSQLSDLELASRLSYFLWSHPPDATLYQLAEQGRLSAPSVLRQQVDRMLDDPKSNDFFDAFTSQWLNLPWLDMIVVDTNLYPDFNENLRSCFREETVQFVRHLILNNLSVTNLIDSDFVVINRKLSEFYGINTRLGNGTEAVKLPADSPRGGLLGQASVLTMTGTGDRTSPVLRGVFVYSRLLGKQIPPPPPNVPQLEIDNEKNLTVRQTLNAHIEKAQCASCHRRMDPLGFGLEHFDAIGQWRDRERPLVTGGRRRSKKAKSANDGLTIDATGLMPDGKRAFDGHEQMKSLILEDTDSVATGLATSMLTYALGRRVGFADGDFVERFQTDWKKNGYRMRALIHAIVQSEEFQSK